MSLRAALLAALALAACASPPAAPPAAPSPVARHASSLAVSPDGAELYVVNPDADSVSVIDARAGALVDEIALGAAAPAVDARTGRYDLAVAPRHLGLAPAARRLYVTGLRSGELVAVDLAARRVAWRLAVCSEPAGLLVTPDERAVLVACAMDDEVLRVDVASRAVGLRARVGWKPWGLAWSRDASKLYVTHLLGARVSELESATLRTLRGVELQRVAREPDPRVPNGESRGLYDVTPRPGVDELWVPHLLLSTETPQRPVREGSDRLELDFETTVFPAVSVVAGGARAAVLSAASLGVEPTRRRRLGLQSIVSGPHAVDFTPDGRWALMTATSSDDVVVIDAARRVEAPAGLVRPLGGAMPEGLVVSPDGARAWVDLRNSGTVRALRLAVEGDTLTVTPEGAPIPRMRRDPMPAELRLGQRVFYSANSREWPITQNNWVACASCHVEGRSDAVTWLFKAGPRDTPSNAGGTVGTGPLLRTALRAAVRDYWRIITEEQGGDGAAFHETMALRPALLALEAYVDRAISLPVPPRTDPSRVARGRAIFERPSVGCATCHRGDRLTDSGEGTLAAPRLYDVGSCERRPAWPDRAHATDDGAPREACRFDTPSLRGVADSAPYLHDGSAATLRDALERTRGRMGNIEGLTEAELADLVEYMRSL